MNATSVTIGHWKSLLPAFLQSYGRPTDQPTNHREDTLPIRKWIENLAGKPCGYSSRPGPVSAPGLPKGLGASGNKEYLMDR